MHALEPESGSHDTTTPRMTIEKPEDDAVRMLLHRWFVQYNPLYLLSAMLVLGGLTLVSREAASQRSALGALGVAGIAELYAFALIGGAAIVTRAGLRRPAVMLALLTVLFQGDLTLHVETCAYLGVVGRIASALWVVLFGAKLYALSWALELRPSRAAILVPVLGALGLAVLPHLFREVDVDARTTLVALWIFGVGAAGLWTSREVESAVGYDVRGKRALRATWILWALLALGHVAYWVPQYHLELAPLLAASMLLAVRVVRRERDVWALAVGTLVLTGMVWPTALSMTALMAAIVLTIRAFRSPVARFAKPVTSIQPYRGFAIVEPAPPPTIVLERAAPRVFERLAIGAFACVYLSVWMHGWSGGALPPHILLLDIVSGLVCGLVAWKTRRALAFGPLTVAYAHLFVQWGWISAPRGPMQWGVAAIIGGFVLLVGAVGASWHLRVNRN